MRFDEMASSKDTSNSKKKTSKPPVHLEETPINTVHTNNEPLPPIMGITEDDRDWLIRIKKTQPDVYQRMLNWD